MDVYLRTISGCYRSTSPILECSICLSRILVSRKTYYFARRRVSAMVCTSTGLASRETYELRLARLRLFLTPRRVEYTKCRRTLALSRVRFRFHSARGFRPLQRSDSIRMADAISFFRKVRLRASCRRTTRAISLLRLTVGCSRATTRASQHRVKPVEFHVIDIVIFIPHVHGMRLSWHIKHLALCGRRCRNISSRWLVFV